MTDRMSVVTSSPLGKFLPQSIFSGTDYWRASQPVPHGRAGYKEWSHFCAFDEQLSIILNFSVIGLTASEDIRERHTPHVVMIVRQPDGVWEGDIEVFSSRDLRFGNRGTDIEIGTNRATFADGLYQVEVKVQSDALNARLRFHPIARPAVASSVRLSAQERMRWLVVPRLVTEGEIGVGGRVFRLKDTPAYHDRNWGHFRWGEDYSWEWATIIPTSLSVPWSLVYMRISDASRNRTYSQGLMVWCGDQAKRVFHGSALHIKQIGQLKQKRTFRLPRIVNLMVPGEACLPRSLEVEGHARCDQINIGLTFEDFAQIGVPNDGASGLTLLSEAVGKANVTGRIDGSEIEFEAGVLAEFNHAAG